MTILKHELRQGKLSLFLWTGTIGFLLAICICLFPEMKAEMREVSNLFSSMGSFTAAFGMDRLNFGSFIGFYGVECGNILGLGGALFASMIAAGILSKEEKNRTAEFLLSHPISRMRILTEKLAAVLIQVTVMNGLIYVLAIGAMMLVKETIPWKEINLLHLAYYLMQLELASICFGISAFLKKGSTGIGLGLAFLMYFFNLIANISESAKVFKYMTPFSFCEAAEIVSNGRLDQTYLMGGIVFGVIGIFTGYWKYLKKDIL